ncbi:phytoene desaturase family protein [Salisediminibacterium selenitireducens]|uniref:4,4'-diaponeurosporene oxygenase n=1 Tax=Bacillus selenitireducens (strain ATCC 700615 / DSM 15326 / MLS10) TaxID=439292 RepID=D6Y117_BACIE|nr:phytoene desaturase family protein [Salisediminibacterium selenitireducens]ADH98621.1 phytoene desaturase [[Bacillus] selenitireducens MLS10]
MNSQTKKAIVIGGGLGGLSAAISLKGKGFDVEIIEKNETLGGKLNRRSGKGFTFDTGPSILTMPWVLEELFTRVHRRVEDYMTIERIEPQWRTFFEDGTSIDVTGDLPDMIKEMGKVAPDSAGSFAQFFTYSEQMYQLCMKSFYKTSIPGLNEFRKLHNFKELMAMDPFHTVADHTKKHFDNKYLEQLFNFFVMYVGSNPYQSPAILNQLIYVQLGLGIHYVKGGMYGIAQGMERVLEELRVPVKTGMAVSHIKTEGEKATGVVTEDGAFHAADLVVSNLEAIPAYQTLLPQKGPAKKEAKKLSKTYEPTVSGLVLLLGTDRTFDVTKHHNFFFSEDPEKEFRQIYEEGIPADDPTVYIGVSSKSDPSQAPDGKENLFVLTHVPPKTLAKKDTNWEDYRKVVLDKLERMGMTGLRESIEFEYRFTPDDLEELYGANGGSIYGIASNKATNGGFKIPAQSNLYDNLFFTGGSTHPGGGVPMVTLSGQLTADLIEKSFA